MAAHHYAELLSYFSRSLGDRDAARDVVQEAYARLLAMTCGGLAVRNARALLFRTGKNLVIDGARRRASEGRMLQSLALLQADDAPSTEHIASVRQQLDRLLARLQAMPRRRREAFVLVRIHGYSYAEAAQHMGVSSDAVDRHVVRAVLDCARYRPDAQPK